jgi:hypothetical protein
MPATAVAHRPSSCRRACRGCPRLPQVCSCRPWAVVGEALVSPQVREGGLSDTATRQRLVWPVDGVSPCWYELPCCVVDNLDPTSRRSRHVADSALECGLGRQPHYRDPHCRGDEFCRSSALASSRLRSCISGMPLRRGGMATGVWASLAGKDDDMDEHELAPMRPVATQCSSWPLSPWGAKRRRAVVSKRCCPSAVRVVQSHQPRLCPLAPSWIGSLVGVADASLMGIVWLSAKIPFGAPAVWRTDTVSVNATTPGVLLAPCHALPHHQCPTMSPIIITLQLHVWVQ